MQNCKFDQSAYISYLVDEAVKASETSTRTPFSSQQPSRLATPGSLTPPYPIEGNFPQTTGVYNGPVTGNGGFQAPLALPGQGQIGTRPPGHQYLRQNQGPVSELHNIAPGFSASVGTCTNYSDTNLHAYKTSSFCLNQHIGLNEPEVVNASQLNNTIQVQYHFTDNDRFSVQSTNTAQVNAPSLNQQTLNNNIPESRICGLYHNGNEGFETGIVQNFSNTYLRSKPTDVGDFSQFCVANIIERNSACLKNDISENGSKTFSNTVKRNFDHHAEEQEYYNLFMLKEKQKDKEKQREKNQDNCTTSLEKDKPRKKTIRKIPNRNNNKVSTHNGNSSLPVQVNEADIARPSRSVEADRHQKDNLCAPLSGADLTRQLKTVMNNIPFERKPDYHAVSREYYRQYILLVKELNKHTCINYTKGEKESCEAVEESRKTKNTVVDLIGSEELDDVNMACENEENKVKDTGNENEGSKMQSFLCSYCGYDSKTTAELSDHLKSHEDKMQLERTEKDFHKEEREYLQMSKELDEIKKKRVEESDRKMTKESMQTELLAETKGKEAESAAVEKKRAHSVPSPKKITSGREDWNFIIKGRPVDNCSQQEEHRHLHKRKAATQAKNSLMNPSKGKQKVVRDIRNLNDENEVLLKMFGIIPSKVYLSRVKESRNVECQNVNIVCEKNDKESNTQGDKNKTVEESRRSPRKRNVASNEWNKVISMSNSEIGIKDSVGVSDDKMSSYDDSDVEIVEPPKTLIVLDDDIYESSNTKDNSRKSDKELMKTFGIRDVAVKLDKAEKMYDKMPSDQVKSRSKSDTELLEKFGMKDLSVSLTNTPTKVRKTKPGPKSKTLIAKIKTGGSKSTNCLTTARNVFEDLSPNEIEKMLHECGMGISVPASTKGTVGVDRVDRTPSPVPSTSKGHGHLKRKRTARKSTKDSALFKKYKLKDSKVMLKSLSRIDISLLRNPNSPFGKTDWLKHKFDSDTESDFEFDIPTPPLVEDFIENTDTTRNDGKDKIEQSSKVGRGGRRSPVKQKDLRIMEKFGIVDSVVVIDSPKKRNTSVSSEVGKKKTLSDDDLRKKFGIPSNVVVVNSSNKSNAKREQTEVKTQNIISFADFSFALDSARKNILSRLKADQDSRLTDIQNNYTKKETNLYKDVERKTRRKANVIEEKYVKSPKRQRIEGNYRSGKRSDLRSASIDCVKLNDKRQTDIKPVPIKKRVSYSGSKSEKMLKKILPSRLKTVSVKLHRLKLNEALKTYKAKAVSRAIEVRHKKNRNMKDTDERSKVDSKKSPSSHNRLRHRRSDVLMGNSVKTKDLSVKEKQISVKAKGKRDKQVVKTARYRRSVAGYTGLEQDFLKETENSNLEKMAKGLPVVKVTVPCLSSDEIYRLSQNILPVEENNGIHVSQNLDAKMVSEEVINQIIDKICCLKKFSAETVEQLSKEVSDQDENNADSSNNDIVKEPCTSANSQMKSVEKKVQDEAIDIDNNTNVTESESTEEEKIAFSNKGKNYKSEMKGAMHEALMMEDTESDLSLISVMSENKETENETFSCKSLKGDVSHGDNSINCKEGNVIRLGGRTCIADLESIPLGSSKFYDEVEKENSYDEVDGDIEGENEGPVESIVEIILDEKENSENEKAFESNIVQEIDWCEMDTKQESASPPDCILTALIEKNDKVEHNENNSGSSDEKIVDIGESNQRSVLAHAQELNFPNNELEMLDVSEETENKCIDDNGLVENQLFAETESALNETELTESMKDNDYKRTTHGVNEDKGMPILSAIIDSESGSRIGDVYTVDGAAKSMRRETSDNEKRSCDIQKEYCPKTKQPEVASSDIIETLMEN